MKSTQFITSFILMTLHASCAWAQFDNMFTSYNNLVLYNNITQSNLVDWTNIVTFVNAASTTEKALSEGTSSFYETYKKDLEIVSSLALAGFSYSSISTGMCPKENTSFNEMIASSVALERDSAKKNTDDARGQALANIYDGFVKFFSSSSSFSDDLMASLDLWRLHSHCYFVLEKPLVVNGTMLEPTVDKCLANEASVIIQYLEEDQNNDLTVLSMFIQLSSCGVNKDNINSPQKWRLESIQSFTGTVNKGLVPFSTIEKKLQGRLDAFAQNTEPLSVSALNSMEVVTELTAGNCPRDDCGKKGEGSSGAVSKDSGTGKGIFILSSLVFLWTVLV